MSDKKELQLAEERLDQVFLAAFATNDPAMLDWVQIKFALKANRRSHRPDSALRVALEALKSLPCYCALDFDADDEGGEPSITRYYECGKTDCKRCAALAQPQDAPQYSESALDRFAEDGAKAWANPPESAKLIRQVEPTGEHDARLEALAAALRKINSEFRPHHIAALEKYENAGTEALEDPAFVEACALEQVHEIASDALGEERWYEADAARSRGEGKV